MKDMYSPTGWENTVECANTPYEEGPFTLQKQCWEEILELIDNYAETRHTCGHWTYNLKSNESRQKVVAALRGNDLS